MPRPDVIRLAPPPPPVFQHPVILDQDGRVGEFPTMWHRSAYVAALHREVTAALGDGDAPRVAAAQAELARLGEKKP